MRDFVYLQPESLADALAMLAEHGDEACIFAGGTALLLGMRARMLAPGVLVSLSQLNDLRSISYSAAGLRIGALAHHSDVARSDAVLAHYPMLAGMAANLANPQVRNQGTIGGNLCYADPATDPPACLIAMDAEVTLAGPDGERRLPMRDFSLDFFTTDLEPGEILTAIHLPPPEAGRSGIYRRHLRTLAEHRPVASVALTFAARKGACEDVRLVVGAAAPSPQTMTRAQDHLTGRALSLEVAAEVADLVAAELDPISDGRGDGEFRRRIVRTAARRAIAEVAGLDWKDSAE